MDSNPMATSSKPRPTLTDLAGKPAPASRTEWVGAQFCANKPVKVIDEKHAAHLAGGLVVSAIPKPGSNPPVVAVRLDTTGEIHVFDATQLEALA
jgi:hypothetical protein